ncbi:MAG: bile acid:sodium symporter [Pseudomonadota bacterium]
MAALDQAQLNFNPDALLALNVLLALIMFGVGLDLRWRDVSNLRGRWPVLFVGLAGQWLLLPLVTVALALALQPHPSLALGMIIIAACPGGSVSNFFSHLAKGDIALSIALSAITSAICFVTTPFAIVFWGQFVPDVAELLRAVHIDWLQMLVLVISVLLFPACAGALVGALRPTLADRLRTPFKIFSMGAFGLFVVVAFVANGKVFVAQAHAIVGIAAIHNGLALLAGFLLARVCRLHDGEARSITIEVGIQNTALGLTVIFTFFAGLGGTALLTAWWGVWHLITGAGLALLWHGRPLGAPRVRATMQ